MILEAIDKFIVQQKPFEEPQPKRSHYPSSCSCATPNGIIGGCLRAEYWAFKGIVGTNPSDAGGIWNMKLGKLVEIQVLGWLSEMGVLISKNQRFYDKELNVSGEVDGFTWAFQMNQDNQPVIIEPREVIGLEIKSAFGYAFWAALQHKPKLEHLLQVIVYLKNFPKVKKFYIIYVARDNPLEHKKSFIITLQDGVPYVNGYQIPDITYNGIKARWDTLNEFLMGSITPGRDYTLYYPDDKIERLYREGQLSKSKYGDWKKGKGIPSDWQCQYCDFKDKCYPDRIADFERRTKAKQKEARKK